jgi:D-serine deaminase-like pyridoxal phosphate-dependent protein
VAQWQIDRGAVGICCAKLGEAEVFADAGIADIRLPYPLNPANASRVIALSRRVRLSFIVDHLEVARGWSQALTAAGTAVDVLVKVDVGFHRCGIDPGAGALPFIRAVASLPGLRLRGLLSHAGQAYHASSEHHLRSIAEEEAASLQRLAGECRAAGVAIEEISAGATPTARFSLQQDGLTEYRPGNYVYFDRTQVALGAASLDDCALTISSRVVSKPAADRIILDSGSKSLTNDGARGFAPLIGFGALLAPGPGSREPALRQAQGRPEQSRGAGAGNRLLEELLVERLSEEHATVRVSGGLTDLEPGDLVRILPNHSCVVSNLVDAAWLVAGDEVIEPLPIAARGRAQ